VVGTDPRIRICTKKSRILNTVLNFLIFQVIRTDTVFDQLKTISGMRGVDLQKEAEKTLLGQVVITRYNNRTYR
jgi:hypothetical protein